MERIAIIENSPFLSGHFAYFLDSEGIGHESFPVWRGASMPTDDFTAFIMTGAFHSVLDGLKGYHRRGLDFLEGLGGRKLFASCFSHQLIAQTHGGRVRRRESRLFGWERLKVTGEHPALPAGSEYTTLCVNSDEVTEPPPDARLVATSENCGIQVLAYGDLMLTCQAHPEITVENGYKTIRMLGLLAGRRALSTVRNSIGEADDNDSERFMRGIVRWLRS